MRNRYTIFEKERKGQTDRQIDRQTDRQKERKKERKKRSAIVVPNKTEQQQKKSVVFFFFLFLKHCVGLTELYLKD